MSCDHKNLLLLPKKAARKRCRVCALTIDAAEIGDQPCPECLDGSGVRRYEFDDVPAANSAVEYRCTDCGVLVR